MDLTLACHSLAGVSFYERVAAAAEAGFGGIGLTLEEYDRARTGGLTDAGIEAILVDHGMVLTELEVVKGLARIGGEQVPGARVTATTPETLGRLLRVAERFGVRRLQALGTFDVAELEPDAAERFAALCDAAASGGMVVALEFLPGTNVPGVEEAGRIVREADRPNGGVCIDTWHFFRGGADFAALAALPTALVAMIQINDGTSVPADSDYLRDTVSNRMLPGTGEFHLERFFEVLGRDGTVAPVSAEVMSTVRRSLPARQAAAELAAAARSQLARGPVPCGL